MTETLPPFPISIVSKEATGVEIQKPKKNRKAYALFAIDARPKFNKSSGHNLTFSEMQTEVSKLWKHLPLEEKKVYQDKAYAEKLQYLIKLKSFYQNASKETIKEITKAKPKKVYSGYCLFVKEMKDKYNAFDPQEYRMKAFLKTVSEKWEALSYEEKSFYQKKATKAQGKVKGSQEEDGRTTKINEHAELPNREEPISLDNTANMAHINANLNSKRSHIEFEEAILNNYTAHESNYLQKRLKIEQNSPIIKSESEILSFSSTSCHIVSSIFKEENEREVLNSTINPFEENILLNKALLNTRTQVGELLFIYGQMKKAYHSYMLQAMQIKSAALAENN